MFAEKGLSIYINKNVLWILIIIYKEDVSFHLNLKSRLLATDIESGREVFCFPKNFLRLRAGGCVRVCARMCGYVCIDGSVYTAAPVIRGKGSVHN